MANFTSAVNVNVDANIKEEATKIFKNLNLTKTDAINLYLEKIIEYNGIPFKIVKNPKKNK